MSTDGLSIRTALMESFLTEQMSMAGLLNWALCGMLVLPLGVGQIPQNTITVCELFRTPDKWDGRIVRIKGLALITREADPDFTVLIPPSGETCTFRNTPE